MKGRPLCVALVIVAAVIVLCHYVMPEDTDTGYKGVKKKLRCQVEEISGQGNQITLTVQDVIEGGEPFCSRMKLYNGSKEDIFSKIKIGNIILIYGEVYSFSKPGNPGQFNEYKYYREQKVQYRVFVQSLTLEDAGYDNVKQGLHEIRSSFFQMLGSLLPEQEAGIIAAMVLGEKCALTEEVRELYQENGIAHILAISGLHISIIGAGLFFFLRRFVMPMRAAAVVSGILLLLYGELTGFPVATKRAVIMMLCVLGARFLGRRYDLPSALALSALIQLLIQPEVLFQAGFLLSYGTVLGIALFVGVFTESGPGINRLWKVLSGSLGIYLVTLPILLYFYFEITTYSVLVNVILLPFVSSLVLLSLAGGSVAFFYPMLGRFLFGAVHYILCYYEFICQLVVRLPYHLIVVGCPGGFRILVYYAILAGWSFFMKAKKGRKGQRSGEGQEKGKKRFWLLCLAVVILIFPAPMQEGLSITNLDVGQGDCSCIRVAGRIILVDGGSSDVTEVAKYRISKYLKYHGMGKIDYIFMTHSDSDHTSGILEILEESGHMGFEVGTVILPDIEKQDDNYKKLELTCRQSGIRVKKMKKGDEMQIENLSVSCLHPQYEYEWQTENDYSLVLQLEYGRFRGILTGDLEQTGEESLLQELKTVDYLKVGHHGSKGSSSEAFLSRLRPVISVISVGEGNRYGHPSREALERLKKVGTRVYCTSEKGAVMTWTDGEKVTVETYK